MNRIKRVIENSFYFLYAVLSQYFDHRDRT